MKDEFNEFLREIRPANSDELMRKFDQYLSLLIEENRKVNLFSRQTDIKNFRNLHFLDSLLPLKLIDFSNKTILDLGTGGGLPGIPISIVNPLSSMYLLDSRFKKINSLKKIIKSLDLKRCFTIVSRLEEMDDVWEDFFDIIVCRSVKILPKFKKTMFKILKEKGKIILYKSRKTDDVQQFEDYQIHNFEIPAIGSRKIIVIGKQ